MKPSKLFQNTKKCELYIDKEKIIVDNEKTYFWATIKNEEIYSSYSDHRFKEVTVNILRFEVKHEFIEIPLYFYKVNEHYLARVIETIRKFK
jgi:hypothetical protein